MSQVFANTIDGNPIYAKRAEEDQNGVNIATYYAKLADLAAVAFSGSWNDLANTPSIPTKTSDLTNDSGFITASDIPAIPTKTSDLTNDSGFITASDIPAQVNADWNENDPTDPAYIENKPTIPDAQVNSDWNAASGVAQILNKPDMSLYALISSLSTVATSGSYLDLTDLPTISNVPAVTSTDDGKVLKASYSGGTGSYSWETAPSGLPASTSADEGKVLKVDANGDPEWQAAPTFTQEQADWNESDTNDPAYIKNKPTIPTVDQTYNASSANAQSGTAVAGAIAGVKQVPASTSADEGKVLKVDANGDPEWDTAPASQVQADWTESDNTDPSYIQNKPTEQALVAGQGITITEANNQVTIGCNVQAPVQDVTYGGSSVVNAQGVAEIPAPSYPVTDVTMDGTSVLNNGVAALTSEVEILEYGSTGAWAKLTAAITAGKSILCKVNRGSNNYRMVPLSFYNTVSGTAEFNFHRFTSSKGYTTQSDELYAYTLASDGTWTTNTNNVAMKYMNGDGLDRTVVTGGSGSITFSVKPAANGGVNVDSNGVSVDVKEAPSDGKEYVRKNGAWVESSGAVETVLFSDPAGLSIKNSSLVLSESASNFDRVKFIYRSNDGYQRSVDIIPSATLKVDLANIDPMTNGNTYVKAVTLLSSDGITWTINAGPTEWKYKSSDGTGQGWGASGNVMYIIKVIGIKNGVNLYNVDRGETVLGTYNSSNPGVISYSEALTNFARIRLKLMTNDNVTFFHEFDPSQSSSNVVVMSSYTNSSANLITLKQALFVIDSANKTFTRDRSVEMYLRTSGITMNNAENVTALEIVGINRIAST